MNFVLSLLIVAATANSAHGSRPPDAVELFHCTFDESWDVNYDGWPDHWVRKRDPGFPSYLTIGIHQDESATAERCLKIELDGGAAAVYSAAIPIDDRFAYLLETDLKTLGLVHDVAFISLTFYDAEHQPVKTLFSQKHREALDWVRLQIGPFSPAGLKAKQVVIGLHVEPTGRQDLQGEIKFDNVWLARLPWIELAANSPHKVYSDPSEVCVSCSLSGIAEAEAEIEFELLDVAGNRLARERLPVETSEIIGSELPPPNVFGTSNLVASGYTGTVDWRPMLEAPGRRADRFYRVRATLHTAGSPQPQREVPLAVIGPLPIPSTSEFGWSLPRGDDPLSLEALARLLPQVGIHWLKFPVWYDQEATPQRGDQLLSFAEQLGDAQIELVGVLASPPPAFRKNWDAFAESPQAASIFSLDANDWAASLEPVLARLSFKVRYWQLGHDHDTSFVGYPDLPKKIAEIRNQLYRYGQRVCLGLGWSWLVEPVDVPHAPWEFLTLSADPPLTGAELETYLSRHDRQSVQRWVLIEPLARSEYSLAARIDDLLQQVIAAKVQGADRIIVPNPIDDERGLMNSDGTPGELLLPWRTAALTLGGAEYLGSIRLPQKSHNQIFVRDGEAIMVLWNETPTQEVLYLGDDLRQIDIWGRIHQVPPSASPDQAHCQVIDVGPLPTFLVGVNEQVARWRMAVQFEHDRIPSIFGTTHRNTLRFTNMFSQGGGGNVTLVMPPTWDTYPRRHTFRAAAGDELADEFEIKLPFTASTGLHEVRIDFNVHADRHYRFSVYRELQVGLGDIEIEVTTKLTDDDVLIVEQRMLNKTDQVVDFKCLLHAPDRRRETAHVIQLGRGENVQRYYFPRGHELLGDELWLRAEETTGPRIFNHHFIVPK